MKKVFIGFGSNVGNNIQNINYALSKVKELGNIVDTSFLYRTDPMYNTAQDMFLNGAFLLETKLSPHDLISKLQKIELNLGRDENMKKIWKGPRTIDLDIIFYENQIIETGDLVIPHPRLAERDFVLKPMLDITKNFKHPIFNKSVEELDQENEKNNKVLSYPRKINPIFNRMNNKQMIFDFSKSTGKLGVLNCTPDSMSSDTSEMIHHDDLEKKAYLFLKEGFEFLDIGGESTRPNATKINEADEINRIKPLFDRIKSNKDLHDIVYSIDTTKSKVAEYAIEHGASIINDISAGTYDTNMIDLASSLNTWMILNHTRGTPDKMSQLNQYGSIIDDICAELIEKINIALSKGVYRWNIIADPGIGFAKSKDQNMSIIENLDKFCSFINMPTALSFSEKKFVKLMTEGNTIYGNTILSGIAIQKGAAILRVHDPQISKSIAIADRIYKKRPLVALL